jgi:translation initiation factor IF-2
MSKIRVYELAKELGLENKALIQLCDELAIDGKASHSNSLTDDEAEKIRRFVIRKAVSGKQGGEREVTREGKLVTERRVGKSVIRRRKKDVDEGAALEAASAAENGDRHSTVEDDPRDRDFPSLSPDLGAERSARAQALEAADALFSKPSPEVASEETEVLAEEVAAEEAEAADTADTESETPAAATVAEEPQVEVNAATEDVSDGVVEEELVEEAAVEDAKPADVDEPKDETEGETPLEAEAEKTEEETSQEEEVRLDDIRKRHDIRAPKVLGKIELPSAAPKASPKAATKSGSKRGASKDVNDDPTIIDEPSSPGRGGRGKRKRTGGDSDDFAKRKGPRKKQVLSKKELVDYDGDRDVWKGKRDRKSKKPKVDRAAAAGSETAPMGASKRMVKIDGEITVGELARQMGLKAGEVIAKLMGAGVMASINQLVDFDTATLVAEEFNYTTQNTEQDFEVLVDTLTEVDTPESLEFRPPVVTVMGHVDHGKTSLLDAIRQTEVTDGEFGGITQHIGAYNVKLASGGSVTFLDTPGHEAFTAMRSRGAQVTDIVVLVVAANDGVMPQTIEAINHAKAAEVPIIVAINKMDIEGANADKVIGQLAEFDLVPEEWGGDTLVVKVSAHTKEGVDTLLENLHLQAEILELKANPNRRAVGTVIESKVDKGRGPVISVLVQKGTLKKGDAFVSGAVYGKVRALADDDGLPVDEAGCSIPVEILGVSSPAAAGDDFIVLESESQARKIASDRALRQRRRDFASVNLAQLGGPLTLERFSEMVTDSEEVKELPLIVKADVQGSVEAVADSLADLSNEEVRVKIIHKAVGGVTENDVQLASASQAILVAFNVRPDVRAATIIESEGVDVLYSRVIYDLVDSVESALKGRMAPKFQEKTLGRVEVRETFKVPKQGVVAGSYVIGGVVQRNALIRLLRDGVVIHEGKLGSLRRFKDDVKEVATGYECGIGIDGYSDIKNGDVIEVYKIEEVAV